MDHIRKAVPEDAVRLTEIEIFNYRLFFYPIFRNDDFYFQELNTQSMIETCRRNPELLERTYVYDDGVVKGFCRINETKLEKLFVEPVLQGQGIGSEILAYAVREHQIDGLWALEKNTRAIRFYERHGFRKTEQKKLEEDTSEYLIWIERLPEKL